jgi:hypothetical protein
MVFFLAESQRDRKHLVRLTDVGKSNHKVNRSNKKNYKNKTFIQFDELPPVAEFGFCGFGSLFSDFYDLSREFCFLTINIINFFLVLQMQLYSSCSGRSTNQLSDQMITSF